MKRSKIWPLPDTPKERQRLLRLLSERPATLTLPLSNRAMLAMLDGGEIAISGRWREETPTRCYDCVKVEITELGREACVVPLKTA